MRLRLFFARIIFGFSVFQLVTAFWTIGLLFINWPFIALNKHIVQILLVIGTAAIVTLPILWFFTGYNLTQQKTGLRWPQALLLFTLNSLPAVVCGIFWLAVPLQGETR